jgi:hypothetical protein
MADLEGQLRVEGVVNGRGGEGLKKGGERAYVGRLGKDRSPCIADIVATD